MGPECFSPSMVVVHVIVSQIVFLGYEFGRCGDGS